MCPRPASARCGAGFGTGGPPQVPTGVSLAHPADETGCLPVRPVAHGCPQLMEALGPCQAVLVLHPRVLLIYSSMDPFGHLVKRLLIRTLFVF